MINRLLNIVAPHLCYGCSKLGTTICENCKYNIVSEPYERCLNCRTLLGVDRSCSHCRTPYRRSWAVGERHDILEKVLNGYKFSYEKDSHAVLAGLLDAVLPNLPKNIIVTYIPTLPSHIRQRGFDHAKLIARSFSRTRSHFCAPHLVRITNSKQLGASRKDRMKQAERAFSAQDVVKDGLYLIVDDIFTTGATMKYAAQSLLEAGAGEVWVAVIARQPLD